MIRQMGADHGDCMFPEGTQRAVRTVDLGRTVGIDELIETVEKTETQHARTFKHFADVGAVDDLEDGR